MQTIVKGRFLLRRKTRSSHKKYRPDMSGGGKYEVGLFNVRNAMGKLLPQIAYENEYGTAKVPQRPFFRVANKLFQKDFRKVYISLNAKMWKNPSLRMNPIKRKEFFLKNLAIFHQGLIRKSIRDMHSPPNSKYTIRKKGFNNPLIETGKMLASITWKLPKGE